LQSQIIRPIFNRSGTNMPIKVGKKIRTTGRVVATIHIAVAGTLMAAGSFSPSLEPISRRLMGDFFFLMEALFWLATSNEMMLVVGFAVFASVFVLRGLKKTLEKAGTPGSLASRVLWAVLALFAIVALFYTVAFAALSQMVYFAIALVLASLTGEGVRRSTILGPIEDQGDPIAEHFWPFVALFVFQYLFLGMVAGHFATPIVFAVSAALAKVSANQPAVYRMIFVLTILAPWYLLLPGWIGRLQGKARRAALFAPLSLLLLVVAPDSVAIYSAGALAAIALGLGLSARGLRPIALFDFSPRHTFARVLFVGLIALNAMTVHYFAVMWRCADELPGSIKRISSEAGAFDMAVTADSGRLLVSLREPQRVLKIDLASKEQKTLLDTSKAGGGTGHVFSTVEPEILLPLAGQHRFLVLLAVSDDENENRIGIVGPEGSLLGTVEGLPRTCVSDLVADENGLVYASTEFDDKIFTVDPGTLEVIGEINWPGAETNKILVSQKRRTIYSLGLWWDDALRAFDMNDGGEVAAYSVGTKSWDMALDEAGKTIYVPRFLTGKVLAFDAETLFETGGFSAGFGARATDLDEKRRMLYVTTMYGGEFLAYNLDTGKQVFSAHLGGHIKSVVVDRNTGRVYTGSNSGIFEIDPARF
jgi:hypothetical protein